MHGLNYKHPKFLKTSFPFLSLYKKDKETEKDSRKALKEISLKMRWGKRKRGTRTGLISFPFSITNVMKFCYEFELLEFELEFKNPRNAGVF